VSNIPFVLDLAWPQGIQQGYHEQPVALLLGEADEVIDAARRAGYRTFSTLPSFYRHVEQEILAIPAST
jgi:hypothetical protein